MPNCVEKCLKAYLVFRKIVFPYTHDLFLLLGKFPVHDLIDDRDATMLSSYAITTRYPGMYKVSKKDAMRAVELAEHVRMVIRAALRREGLTVSSKPK